MIRYWTRNAYADTLIFLIFAFFWHVKSTNFWSLQFTRKDYVLAAGSPGVFFFLEKYESVVGGGIVWRLLPPPLKKKKNGSSTGIWKDVLFSWAAILSAYY